MWMYVFLFLYIFLLFQKKNHLQNKTCRVLKIFIYYKAWQWLCLPCGRTTHHLYIAEREGDKRLWTHSLKLYLFIYFRRFSCHTRRYDHDNCFPVVAWCAIDQRKVSNVCFVVRNYYSCRCTWVCCPFWLRILEPNCGCRFRGNCSPVLDSRHRSPVQHRALTQTHKHHKATTSM